MFYQYFSEAVQVKTWMLMASVLMEWKIEMLNRKGPRKHQRNGGDERHRYHLEKEGIYIYV